MDIMKKFSRRTQFVWKILRLGVGLKHPEDFVREISLRGTLGQWGRKLLFDISFKVSETEKEIDLVTCTSKDMGFRTSQNLKTILQRAIELGLEPCPPEVGPRLFLEYQDQFYGEDLYIGMEPLGKTTEGYSAVFMLDRSSPLNNKRTFSGASMKDRDRWDSNCLWVFARLRR